MPAGVTNRGWLWLFVLIALLAAAGVTWLIVFNRGQQLRRETLEAARQRWQQHGPRDYRLVYTMKKDSQPPDHYVIRVRDGVPERGTLNGKPLPAEALDKLDVKGLFELVDAQLREKEQPGNERTFLRAQFDADYGHLTWYLRTPPGGPRLEMSVETLEPLTP
jgi:hypothetical protein